MLFILLTWLLPTVYYSQAIAQEAAETSSDSQIVTELPAEKVGERANELLTRINAHLEDAERYNSAMAKASAEDCLVLQLQSHLFRQRALDDVHQLADELLELEKAGQQPELRKQVESLFARITPLGWFHINRLRGEIDTVRSRRLEATQDERYAIENEVAKLTSDLDDIFAMGLTHIEKMEHMGMDTKEPRAVLTKLLSDRADELSGRMALSMDRVGYLEAQIREIPDDANVAKLLIAATKSLDINVASLEGTLELMDALELNTDEYRSQLVTATKDFSSGLMDKGVLMGLLSRTMKSVTSWPVA
jgi:hypothetical protein